MACHKKIQKCELKKAQLDYYLINLSEKSDKFMTNN